MDVLDETGGQQQQQEEPAIKLGVVYLGRALGKHKFTLLDEVDIAFVRPFALRAWVELDRNGHGASVYAMAQVPPFHFPESSLGGSRILFHELLWKHHYGRIKFGHRIFHKNGITVDNRLENLEELPVNLQTGEMEGPALSESERQERARSASLYKIAITQLPPMTARNIICPLDMDENGVTRHSSWELDDVPFFECRRAACTTIENQMHEFAVCSRCLEARYCSPECQETDWADHKRDCQHVSGSSGRRRRTSLSCVR